MTATSATTALRGAARSDYAVSTALRTGAAAGVAAAVLNVAVSVVARGAFDASDDFVPLTPGPIVAWTILGTIVGAAGWRLIVNRRPNARALLNVLVPTVLVLSLIPDVALLASDSMAGQTTAGVLALMLMHVLTAVVAVAAYRRTMPPA